MSIHLFIIRHVSTDGWKRTLKISQAEAGRQRGETSSPKLLIKRRTFGDERERETAGACVCACVCVSSCMGERRSAEGTQRAKGISGIELN